MSNEEIAILIKQGQKELYGELWNNMERWFYKLSTIFIFAILSSAPLPVLN